MKLSTLRTPITIFCFIFVFLFGNSASEVFAASECPDANGNCEIEGHVNVTDPDPNNNVYKINGETVLRRFYISYGSQKQLLALGADAGLNMDTDYSECYGLTGSDLTNCQIENRSPGNIFIGDNAAESATSAVNSIVIGVDAASQAQSIGKMNTIIGKWANGFSTSTGILNTIIGASAGEMNSGLGNTFIGAEAGDSNTIGSENIFIGLNAGAGHYRGNGPRPIRTGNNNIHIGYQTEAVTDSLSHTIVIGHMAEVEEDHQMVVGSDINYACYEDSNGNYACGGQIEDCDVTPPGADYEYKSCSTAHISESYWGSGIRAESPKDFTFHATGGKGNDVAGANLILAGGKSTGSANGGSIKFQTSSKGASSANQNALIDRMVIDSKGKVGIGTSDPQSALHINGNLGYLLIQNSEERGIHFAGSIIDYDNDPFLWIDPAAPQTIRFWTAGDDRLVINGSGNVGIGTVNPDQPLKMASGAHVTSGGVWTNASSEEYKENISSLSADKAMETLMGLKPVEFNYKIDKNERYVGFIAEDVPELVATNDRKGLSPMDIVAVVTSVVKEQQKAIEEQRQTIAILTEKINMLEREVRLKGSLAMSESSIR